jgi:hypothetical protein
MFDTFRNFVAGAAEAQDEINETHGTFESSRTAERHARRADDSATSANRYGYAGRAGQHERQHLGRRSWF